MWSGGAEPGRRVGRSWSSPGDPLISDVLDAGRELLFELSTAAVPIIVQEFWTLRNRCTGSFHGTVPPNIGCVLTGCLY